MATTLITHSKEKNNSCCLWINSKTCENIKIGVVSSVAATALAAIAFGVLLVLAQQGHNLAGLNSIAQMIEPKWLYLSLGGAGIIVFIDVVVITSMVISYLNKTYSEKELNKLGLTGYIGKHHISEKTQRKAYWELIKEAKKETDKDAGTPAVYAILVKDEIGNTTVRGFKTQKDLDDYKKTLGNDYINGEVDYATNPEYPADFILARFGVQFQNIQNLEINLPKGYYRHWRQDIPNTTDTVDILVANVNGAFEYHFCKAGKLEEIFDAHYTGFIDKDEADRQVRLEFGINVPPILPDNHYWTYEAQVHGIPLYAVAFKVRTEGQPQIRFFPTKEARDGVEGFVASDLKGSDGWIDAKAVLTPVGTYAPDRRFVDAKAHEAAITEISAIEAKRLIAKKDYDSITAKLTRIHKTQYWAANYITTDEKNMTIYALAIGGFPLARFFKTEQARNEAIQASNCYNRSTLEHNIYEKYGTKERAHIESYPEQIFLKDRYNIDGKDIVVIGYPLTAHGKRSIYFRYYTSEAECANALQGLPDLVENKVALEANVTRYKPNYIASAISQEDLQLIAHEVERFKKIRGKSFTALDFVTTNNIRPVYALVYNDRKPLSGKTIYFTSGAIRKQFIHDNELTPSPQDFLNLLLLRKSVSFQ